MSKFHSIVSRRDFMKGLGMAGAGLGAAAAAAPVFHDVDEITASPEALHKNPWYVKTLDHYTCSADMDWSVIPGIHTVLTSSPWQNRDDPWMANRMRENFLPNINKPGTETRDFALYEAWVQYMRKWGLEKFDSFFGPEFPDNYRPDYLYHRGKTQFPTGIAEGITELPKWQGTAEENSRTVRAAFKAMGVDHVGFLKLNADLRRTMFDKDKVRFEDVDKAYKDGKVSVIPNKCEHMVIWQVRMPDTSLKRGAPRKELPLQSKLSHVSLLQGYSRQAILKGRTQLFMKLLGYQAMAIGEPNVALAVLSGLGELCRDVNILSHIWGPAIRVHGLIVTDLPLAPTPPINAGILRFCETCIKCADVCPGGALSFEKEARIDEIGVWESEGGPIVMNRPGVKTYHCDYSNCYLWRSSYGGCGDCIKFCPFNQIDEASIHQVVKSTVAVTPLFNSFFRSMTDFFNYGPNQSGPDKDPIEWWNSDPPMGGLTTYNRYR